MDRDSLGDRDDLEAFPMPLYLCRWPNGDCSVVQATNKSEAVEILDEVDNAEGCPLTPLPDFMVHFHMSDHGEIEFEGFGEAAEDALFRFAYPVLDSALLNAPCDEAGHPTADGLAVIGEAVSKERVRVRPKKVKEPDTELGRRIKRMTGAPTRMINRTIRETAAQTLKRLPTKGKPN
jgi:hypothetical protein